MITQISLKKKCIEDKIEEILQHDMIDVGIGLSKNSINSQLHTQVLKYHNRHIEYDFFLTLTRFSTKKSDPMENEKSTSYVFTNV